MENLITLAIFCFFTFILLVTTVRAQLPPTKEFISLDCGIPDNQNYTDSVTQLPYTSDSQYIHTGKIKNIDSNYTNSSLPRYHQTVRFFPDGDRNCYTFQNITSSSNSVPFLFRATFFHGNYDGSQSVQPGKPIQFELHLGANLWRKVNISDASKDYMFEAALRVYSTDIVFVCLVNTNSGVPFISALEIRPFTYYYPSYYFPLSSVERFNYGEANQTIRYPTDKYDRMWQPYPHNSLVWTEISTHDNIIPPSYDYSEVPLPVLQTAVTPINSPNLTALQWKPETSLSKPPTYYVVIHFAEFQSINSTREVIILINEKPWTTLPIRLSNLQACSIYGELAKADQYIVKLSMSKNSTLPPIINAIELFSEILHDNLDIYSDDIKSIMEIKERYNITKNWFGDPCSPSKYKWDGLNCTYEYSYSRITSINLASYGLNGSISDSFKSFYYLDILDLSCNNLTGPVPDFLGNMKITHLNLAGNPFLGPLPGNLQKQSNNGLITLIPPSDKCGDKPVTHNKIKNNKNIAIGVSVASIVLLSILILVVWKIRQRKYGRISLSTSLEESRGKREENRLYVEFQQFTFDQLKLITNNFSEVIGKGGFGTVYRGLIENEIPVPVAVKLPTLGTATIIKQFLSEAKNLMQVHHRNLVTLIGYCMDQNMHGLVYEYMPNGSLQDHLTSENSTSKVLNWGERLRVAFESAQGLDYLHTGCMIAHRDVKSSNILLGPNFEAKVADFGLAKMFSESTGMSTISLCGTPGYIDPEVHKNPLSEKSDVYSFGIVLMEIITGQAPIAPGRENVNIVDHVKRTLAKGTISDIVDSRLESDYNEKIVRKVLDLAIKCTNETSSERPIMAEVVTQLRYSLSEENLWRSKNMNQEGGAKSEVHSVNSSLAVEMGPSAR